MEPTGPFSTRISSFLEAWAALPQPREVSSELLVVSTGAVSGNWSHRHIYTSGDTFHFVFRKSEITDMDAEWQCADRELESLVKNYIKTEQP